MDLINKLETITEGEKKLLASMGLLETLHQVETTKPVRLVNEMTKVDSNLTIIQ
jgi:hypothetical protein